MYFFIQIYEEKLYKFLMTQCFRRYRSSMVNSFEFCWGQNSCRWPVAQGEEGSIRREW